jgi:hypothetical protein
MGAQAVDLAEVDRATDGILQEQAGVFQADEGEGAIGLDLDREARSLSARFSPRATDPNTARWQMPRRRSSGSAIASFCRTASIVLVVMIVTLAFRTAIQNSSVHARSPCPPAGALVGAWERHARAATRQLATRAAFSSWRVV